MLLLLKFLSIFISYNMYPFHGISERLDHCYPTANLWLLMSRHSFHPTQSNHAVSSTVARRLLVTPFNKRAVTRLLNNSNLGDIFLCNGAGRSLNIFKSALHDLWLVMNSVHTCTMPLNDASPNACSSIHLCFVTFSLGDTCEGYLQPSKLAIQ